MEPAKLPTPPPNPSVSNTYVFLSTLIATMGSWQFGYQGGVLASYSDKFPVHYDYSPIQASFLTSGMLIGAGIGATLAGYLASRGRRKAMILADIIAIVGPGIELIPFYWAFLIGRVICGVVVGLNSCIVPLYVNEISPTRLKGTLGSFAELFICFGLLAAYLVALGPKDSPDYLRFALALAAAFGIIRLICLKFYLKYDTPKYYIKNSLLTQAQISLKKIYVDVFEAQQMLDYLIQEEEESQRKAKVGYKDLLGPRFRKRFLVGCGCSALQQLAGINAICLFAGVVLQSQLAIVIMGIVGVVSALFATCFIQRIGRRPFLFVGCILCGVFLLLYALFSHLENNGLQIAGIMGYYFAFTCTLGSVVWLYIPEIVPDVGTGFATLVNWIANFAVVQIFAFTKEFGVAPNMIAFSMICFIGAVFVAVFVKETKNKTECEIEQLFAGKYNMRISQVTSAETS